MSLSLFLVHMNLMWYILPWRIESWTSDKEFATEIDSLLPEAYQQNFEYT